MPDQFQYIKLPDGSYGKFAASAADSDIQAQIAKDFPQIQQGAQKQGFFSSALDSSGLSSLPSLGHALMHPLDTAAAIPSMVKGAVQEKIQQGHQLVNDYKQGGLTQVRNNGDARMIPIVGPIAEKMVQQGNAGNYAGAAGTVAGAVGGAILPESLPKALPAVGRGLTSVGDAAQEGGVGMMNKTLGALQKDFKRGANPSRGYFNAGGGPALSMQGLAEKSASLKSATGAKLGNIIDSATEQGYTIPADRISGAINPPIENARGILTGPGGPGGENPTGALDAYAQGFGPVLNRDLTPRELFDLKQGIAKNTSWGDPSQIGLKQVRQQQVGALGGVLNDNPIYGPEAKNYQDLSNFSSRAALRAATGSQPLTHLAAEGVGAGLGAMAGGPGGAVAGLLANSIPVKSTLASGLYYGGKLAKGIGEKLVGSDAPSLVAPSLQAPTIILPKRIANGTR